jgi:hypothetical protein
MAAPRGHEFWEWGTLVVKVVEARGLLGADFSLGGSTSDPYCKLHLKDGRTPLETKVVKETLSPMWKETLHFRLTRASAVLRLDAWDQDLTNADDHLGHLEVDLKELHPQGTFRGWIPLSPPEGKPPDCCCGAIHLEVSMVGVRTWRHMLAFVAPPPEKHEPPAFDLNALYGPGLHLQDLLVNRGLLPLLGVVLHILFWESWRDSLLALLLWNFAAGFFLQHWPAFSLVGVAGYILYQRFLQVGTRTFRSEESTFGDDQTITVPHGFQVCRAWYGDIADPWGSSGADVTGKVVELLCDRHTIKACNELFGDPAPGKQKLLLVKVRHGQGQGTDTKELVTCSSTSVAGRGTGRPRSESVHKAEEEREAELGMAVRMMAKSMPKSLKDTLRGFQPLLRLAADSAQMVRDILHWEHDLSPAAVAAFLVGAALLEAFSLSTVLMTVGSAVLLVLSPALTVPVGLMAYLHWRSSAKRGGVAPQAWNMHREYSRDWSSKDSKRDSHRLKSTAQATMALARIQRHAAQSSSRS